MAKPVAKLVLDTRSYGPIYCETCDDDLEDVLLMDDASVVCPECKGDIRAFSEFSDHLTSVRPVGGSSEKKGSEDEMWIIDWKGLDPSTEGPVSYKTREEALAAAADYAVAQAREILSYMDVPSKESDEGGLLGEIISSYEDENNLETVKAWLDYQDEYTPDETFSIGPSGSTSDRSADLK